MAVGAAGGGEELFAAREEVGVHGGGLGLMVGGLGAQPVGDVCRLLGGKVKFGHACPLEMGVGRTEKFAQLAVGKLGVEVVEAELVFRGLLRAREVVAAGTVELADEFPASREIGRDFLGGGRRGLGFYGGEKTGDGIGIGLGGFAV